MSKLVIVHSLTATKLRKAIELGGMPLPSIAAMLPDNDFMSFGNITFVIKPESVNPKDKKNLFFDRDIFSQRIPQVNYDVSKKEFSKFYNDLNNFINTNQTVSDLFSMYDFDSLLRKPSDYIYDRVYGDNLVRFMFAIDYIKDFKLPMKEYKYESDLSLDSTFKDYMIKNYNKIKYDENFDNVIKETLDRRFVHYKELLGETIANDILSVYRNSLFDNNGNFNRASRESHNLFKDLEVYKISSQTMVIDTEKLRRSLLTVLDEHEAAYVEYVEDKTKHIFTNPHFKNGTKKIPYTLENIEKYMLRQSVLSVEDTSDTSIGKISSSYARQFRSFDDMLDNLELLQKEESRYASIDVISKKIFDLTCNITEFHTSQRHFDVQEDLSLSIKNITNIDQIAKKLLSNGFDKPIPAQFLNEAFEISQSIKHLTNNYFEGKPQKSLTFNDFEAVILPKNIATDIVDLLKDKVKIHFYNSQDERAALFKQYSFEESPKNLKKLKNF
jgi:hypothetical protein